MTRAAPAVACLAALVLVAALSHAPTAQARSCGNASVRGYGDIQVHNGVTCRDAKRKLGRWSRHGFPRNPVGWFCQTSTHRKLCSMGNGNAPYFTFVRRRHR